MHAFSERRRLVVVTGPVGGGKSTVGIELTRYLRDALSRSAAVIDLDMVYVMLRQHADFDEQPLWPIARRGCAALAESFLGSGVDTVVVEGEFFSREHFDQLKAGFIDCPPISVFTLNVSYDETLRRVRGDPARGASKNPSFLKELHTAFRLALPYLEEASLLLDAESRAAVELARAIANELG